ncbi:MAG: transcription termination factor Rho, partial [Balneolaceae bacterium]|nr:transcription termination factor Rho [Balneolaceae bacterium]
MGRSRNNRNRKKNKNVFVPRFNDGNHVEVAGRYRGVTEINEKLYAFARKMDHEFSYEPRDPFLNPDETKKHDLRPGLVIEGEYEEDNHGHRHIHSIEKINDRDPVHWQRA